MTSIENSFASFRFYEELNDFLPASKQKRDISVSFLTSASVKHLIEVLGIPHTEVELIIVNGQSVGFDYAVQNGDRVSVYPMFEAFDVSPLLRLRQAPLRDPCFVADAHLGKLARYLRLLGFDTLFQNSASDRELAATSVAEHRILLTRDRALLMHKAVTHGRYIRASAPKEQLTELINRLQLLSLIKPFCRCMRCNGLLTSVAKASVISRLPPDTQSRYQQFWQCRDCSQVYWQGSHYRDMLQFIALLQTATPT